MPKGVFDRKGFPDRCKAFILEHACEDITIYEMCDFMNRRLGTNINRQNVVNFYRKNHLPRKKPKNKGLFNAEQIAYLNKIIPEFRSNEVAALMNEKYGMDLTSESIRHWKKSHRSSQGYTATYRRQGDPRNYAGREKGRFLKGHEGEGKFPVHTVRKLQEGYWVIKAETGEWQLLHRWLWEQINGPIPEGMLCIVIDGNWSNIVIDNLRLVSKSEMMYTRHIGLTDDPEINQAVFQLASLKAKINKAEKGDD